MKKKTYASWDMAGLRARNYETPKARSMREGTMGLPVASLKALGHRPVLPGGAAMILDDRVCGYCGYHACDCDRRSAEYFGPRAKKTELAVRGYAVYEHPDLKPGDAFVEDVRCRMAMAPSDVVALRAEMLRQRQHAQSEVHKLVLDNMKRAGDPRFDASGYDTHSLMEMIWGKRFA